MLLRREGYWIEKSYKVKLTKRDKIRMGLPSCPRWEIDIVAYRPVENLILAVECKSFLNSPGVSYESFSGEDSKGARRYKLFANPKLRRVVLGRLRKQLAENGLALPKPKPDVKLCLAAGRIRKDDERKIREVCDKNGWNLYAPDWFGKRFRELARTPYEDDIATVAAKLARLGAKE
jgi:hypothetical protein